MGVFNFIDESCLFGCVMLKFSDEWKCFMFFWIEFIMVFGYLFVRKVCLWFIFLVVEVIWCGEF